MRYRFIREQRERGLHDVTTLCEAMKVSRSGYYDWLMRKPCARALEDERLLRKVRVLHYRFKERYGSIRLCRELRKEGESCGKHRIARLKQQERLWTRRRRRFMITTNSQRDQAHGPNLLARRFVSDVPNRIWVGDVTSVWSFEGWLYLAVVLDLYSRRVIGWSMAQHCGEALTAAALRMAIESRNPEPGLLHHTDRGSHYGSNDYQQLLCDAQMRCSMSRTANCLDNAVAESFFSTLKNELTLDERFITRDQARAAIFEFIELFYNPVRQHSHLDGLSPIEFERQPHG